MKTFYLRIKTRSQGSANKGTVKQALEYITEDHDSERLPLMLDDYIAYISRINPGYKTEHEGGRVPLIGHGILAKYTSNEKLLKEQFEEWTIPPLNNGKPTNGIPGYKETALTFSKELSEFCETEKVRAREAITRAIEQTLEETYPGKDIAAVSAMHTRNRAREVHFNTHLLWSKFGRERSTGRLGSMHAKWFHKEFGGNTREEGRMKKAWTNAIVKEFEKEFGITLYFDENFLCHIKTKEGVVLQPLTRATVRERQRAWEIANAPIMVDKTGKEKRFVLNMIDAKILEILCATEINRENFVAVFPSYEKTYHVIEKRIQTLQQHGYIDENLEPTKLFHEHAKVRFGEKPEWEQIRHDTEIYLAKLKSGKEDVIPLQSETKTKLPRPPTSPPISLIEQIEKTPLQLAQQNPNLNRRIQRVNITPSQLKRIEARWLLTQKSITPELREWALLEQGRGKLQREISEKSKALPPATRKSYLETMDEVLHTRQSKSVTAWQKAQYSLQNPLIKETDTIVSEIVQDSAFLRTIQKKIKELKNIQDELLNNASEKDRAYIINYYGKQIRELERTARKVSGENFKRKIRALRMEPAIPNSRTHFTKVNNAAPSQMLSDQQVRKLREMIFNTRPKLHEYLSTKFHPTLKMHIHEVQRGLKILEIQGHEDALILQSHKYKLGSLLQSIASKKAPSSLSFAVMRAKRIGNILEKAEFNFQFEHVNIPWQLKDQKTERQVKLLLARCNALSIPSPDLTGVSISDFLETIKQDRTLTRLVTSGAEFMLDYRMSNPVIYITALAKLSKKSQMMTSDQQGASGGRSRQTPNGKADQSKNK